MRKAKQPQDHDSTLTDVTGLGVHERPYQRWLQTFSHWLLLVIPVIALFGVLDPRTGTSVHEHASGEVEVIYAKVTRIGQAAPLSIKLTSHETLDEPITVTLCSNYLNRLDFQNWYPNPSSETRTGTDLKYTFAPTHDTEFVVTLDARIAPESGISPESCELTVATGTDTISTKFTTWRLP